MRIDMLAVQILALLMCVNLCDAGVSYVRWGRTVCPAGAHAIYKGYMVGSSAGHSGAGANYLCAPEKPKFVRGKAGWQNYAGVLTGVEFEIFDNAQLFLTDNLPTGTLHNQDAVCVVCYVAESTDMLMVPGSDNCMDSGYDLQYKGFLVTEADWAGHYKGEYVCVDEAPEGRVGGTADNNQAQVYPVEFYCGSLPCNPYVDGMEAACAVCTF